MRRALPVFGLAALFMLGGALATCDFSAVTGGGSSATAQIEGRGEPPEVMGATCSATSDCSAGQVCVGEICRAATTSTQAEILFASARSQLRSGDLPGAARTLDASIEAFRAASAPVPPQVVCAAAATLLDMRDTETRERAARLAYDCLHGSLPADATREPVLEALARQRFDGLNLASFDLDEAPAAFFTARPSRPDPSRVRVSVEIDEITGRHFAPVMQALRSETVNAAVQDCFLQDWEIRHESEASADLTVRMVSRLRDHGDYDSYPVELTFEQSSMAQEGFEACLAHALPALVETPRVHRTVQYETHFRASAQLTQ